jgi:hypothetical protein
MSDHQDKKVDPSQPDTVVNPDQTHESQSQEPESSDSSKKIIIVTSAMEEQLSKGDEYPSYENEPNEALTKVHSMIGHLAQGNTYKNPLDLAFDRLVLGADAPEYIAPEKPEEDSSQFNAAYEDFSFGESLGNLESTIPANSDLLGYESVSSDNPTQPNFAPSTKILGEFSVSELGRIRDSQTGVGLNVESDETPENIDLDGFSMDDFDRLTDSHTHDLPMTEGEIESEDTIVNAPNNTSTESIKREDTEIRHDFSTDPFNLTEDSDRDFWLDEDE